MCRVIKFATWPARTVLGLAMDLAFGKAECTDYVSTTSRHFGCVDPWCEVCS